MATLKQQTTTQASDAYTPELLAQEHGGSRPPLLPSSPPFMLCYHPERWMVRGGNIVPDFGRLKLKAGINRVRHVNGRFVVGEAKADKERRGWTVLAIDVQGAGTSYLRKPEGTSAHILQWVETFAGSAATRFDHDGYAAFCNKLVKDGIITPVPLYVLERMRGEIEAMRSVAADQAITVPSAKALADKFAADLAVVDAALKAASKKAKPTRNSAPTIAMED